MTKTSIVIVTLFATMIFPITAAAGVDLPWSTTYNCSDWNRFSDNLSCNGISKMGSWTVSPEGYHEQITAAANHPGGGGGKGQRHWVGNGTNNNSGSIKIDFNQPQSKFWMRWYQRWEAGFTSNWDTFKNVWFEGDGGSRNVFHTGRPGIGGIDLYPPDENTGVSGVGYGSSFYKSGVSDGSWQAFEVHVDIPNNTFKAWINGVLVADNRNVNFGSTSAIVYIILPENCKNVSNSRSMYIDFDDVAISNTGYIGPIAGGGGGGSQDTTPPSVAVSSPSSGDSVSGNVTCTSNAADDTGVAGVQFKLDGVNIGQEDTSAPYSISMDTSSYANGNYLLTAVARDSVGNTSTSSAVNFAISNSVSNPPPSDPPPANALFNESFEDGSFASRGWYDNTNMRMTSSEHVSGSTQSIEFNFPQGAITPTSGSAMRKLITETDSVYVSYYVKYSSNWVGSNQGYHPHEFFIMTNLNGAWDGMASTHLTAYVEQNALRPLMIIQDSENIDTANVNANLVGQTETRAVAGCNGDSDGYGNGNCYQAGTWRNSKHWLYDSPVITAGTWHKVEAYFKLNSIANGIGQQDGVIQYWLDGNLLMDHHNVVFRTGQHPGMKFNQFIIAPYIGDGSPVNQTFWVDNLTVSTARSTGGGSNNVPSPGGLKVMN